MIFIKDDMTTKLNSELVNVQDLNWRGASKKLRYFMSNAEWDTAKFGRARDAYELNESVIALFQILIDTGKDWITREEISDPLKVHKATQIYMNFDGWTHSLKDEFKGKENQILQEAMLSRTRLRDEFEESKWPTDFWSDVLYSVTGGFRWILGFFLFPILLPLYIIH